MTTPSPDIEDTLRQRYATIYSLVEAEVRGLVPHQLDWTSDLWMWSKWSIRQQVSHMASCSYGWLCGRWGNVLYPEGLPRGYEKIAAMSPEERVELYISLDAIGLLRHLQEAISLAQHVLRNQADDAVRTQMISLMIDRPWDTMASAHPTGVTKDPDEPKRWHFSLEATLRHVYFEITTHLYNVQRLKRAQGLPTTVDVPNEGYWALPTWDRSEP